MAQRDPEHTNVEAPPRVGAVVIEYAAPVPRSHRRAGGLLALAVYVASLLLPAIEVQIFARTPDSATPGYVAAYWALAMTVQAVQGEWMGPFPILGTVANVGVVASIALLLFSRKWRAVTWTASVALLGMLGCLPLFEGLRVGYLVWLLSAIVCLAAAVQRRRRALGGR